MRDADKVKEQYARRKLIPEGDLYTRLDPCIYLDEQEKERAIFDLFNKEKIAPLEERRLLEVGCGGGGNLLFFLRTGFRPENLTGVELLEERADDARRIMPSAVRIVTGDASRLPFPDGSFDIVYQSTVFTSLLDDSFQQRLADEMWRLVRPGGAVLWYDFIYNNPSNPDVRGMPFSRVKRLFPASDITKRKITLAPPISRWVTRIHPLLYSVFNVLPILRTHQLCWLPKSR